MATLRDVERIIAGLPEVLEGERFGHRTWSVGGQKKPKAFAWERPYSKADLKRFGDETPPDGDILAVTTADLGEKEALLAAHPGMLFTIEHFNGFAAVLVHLKKTTVKALREVIEDGWLACAPKQVADDYLGSKHRTP
jgi:hypothetical protein